ncbi:hypothetical protein ABZP36_033368 [Zizania latifolia]
MAAGLAPQQLLFPIQNMPTPMTSAPANLLHTSFPTPPVGVPSTVAPQVSQPLFPINTSAANGAVSSPYVASVAPGSIPVPASSPSVAPAGVGYAASNQGAGSAASNNKASATQPGANEVYLMWDDEAMSMEERRLSLPKYQVHDETSQVSSDIYNFYVSNINDMYKTNLYDVLSWKISTCLFLFHMLSSFIFYFGPVQ